MTLDEIKAKAKAEVENANPQSSNINVKSIYENFLDGTLLTVTFTTLEGVESTNHVYFGDDTEIRLHRYFSDVFNTVSKHKERNFFFRFLEFGGISGLIACILIIVFSILLCVFAFSGEPNPGVLEVVKLSFTTILGFFFGSQVGTNRR